MPVLDLELDGLDIIDEIGHGAHAQVYRGTRDGQPVAIKILKEGTTRAHADAALQFRQEASALARLNHPSVVTILEAGEIGERPYIVMEHVQGEDLATEVQRSGPLPEPRIFELASQLASALSEVHRHGLVHQDVKPSNVVCDAQGAPKLIDFGLARARVDEGDTVDRVAGTLLYAPPEQIRLTQRGIDARADLYALGCTLFFCATGQPPFVSDDVSRLIQMHAATEAPGLTSVNPAIGPVLSAIVAKLLAKDPADRYQSAMGLLADLDARAALHASAVAGELVLGTRDFQRLGTEVRLVGRDQELASLQACRADLAAGHGSFVLIEGSSGTGKTRLAREVVDALRGPGTLVLSAKCNAGETTPFGPLRDALDRYVSQLRWDQDGHPSRRDALRRAAGSWGGLLKRLSPGMGWLLQDVPDVAALDPSSEQVRFYDALAGFIAAMAHTHERVVLLVDDVQWLDRTSPQVLRRLTALVRDVPLLVVMTARNQGADGVAVQRLASTLGAGLHQRLTLEPLAEADAVQLISHHLGQRPVDPAVQARIVALGQGNPFAIGQYVRALVECGAVTLGPSGWHADAERLATVDLTDDVVQLVVDRSENLSPDVLDLARTGALLGATFPVQRAVEVVGCSMAHGTRAVRELVRANLLEWVDDEQVSFIHDRIREAMTAPLSQAEQRDRHQAIAQVLDARDSDDAEHTFALARHYAAGHVDAHRQRVFETSLEAGARALDSYAFPEAFEWLQGSLALQESVDPSADVRVRLHEALGVAATRVGQLQLALEQLELAIGHAHEPVDVVRLSLHIAAALATESRFEQAWEAIRHALAVLDAPFPDSAELEGALLQECMARLAALTPTELPTDAEQVARSKLLYQLYATASMAGLMTPGISPTRVPLLIMLGRLVTHPLGVCREAASSETWYGLLLGLMGHKEEAYRHAELSVTMAEQLGDPATLAYTRMYRAWTYEMAGDILLAEPMAMQVEQQVVLYLGAWDYAQWAVTTGYQYVIRGYPHRAIQFFQGRLEQINQTGNLLMQTCAYLILYSQLTMVGRGAEGREYRREWQGLYDTEPDIRFLQACKLDHYMLAAYEVGELDVAIDHAREMLGYNPSDYWTWAMWLVVAYVCRDRLQAVPEADRPAARAELDEALQRALGTSQPPVHRCHLSVLQASVARLDGRTDEVAELLEQATADANACDSPWGHFEVALERARLARALGDEQAMQQAAREALRIAGEQSYVHRVERIQSEFQISPRPAASATTSQLSTSLTAVRSSRRAEALLEVSMASASSLDPKEQARAALDAIVGELGAERGFLLLLEDGALKLKAGRTSDGSDIAELTAYSSTIVEQVLQSQQGVVATGDDGGQLLASESAVAFDLRSIMAAPLMLQGQVLGVVYVDSRLMRGLFVDDDIDFLQGMGSHVALALQTARMANQETQRVAMEKDLALTGSLQTLFLPPSNTLRHEGFFGIAAHYRPMTQCSGDFWWYDGDRDKPLLVVGDVTGHGAGAAMMAVSAMTFLGARSSSSVGEDVDAHTLLSALDTYLHGIAQTEMTISLCALSFDAQRRCVRIVGAAALPILHWTGGQVQIVDTPASLPVGHGKGVREPVELTVAPGDRLLVFTDGLLEMPTARGRQLGIKGVRSLFANTADLPARDIVHALVDGADGARGGHPLEDDLSFFVVTFE
ncbi:MAG: SpoIIE family protein phosphatase [Myxococcales bacterium]|nr:SpoIIE family protein phosphatase [Myxococcales bacterium]